MQTNDLASQLASLPAFAGLSPEALALLAARMTPQSRTEGFTFIRQGERGKVAYLLLEGEVEVTRDVEGVEETLSRLKPGHLFGLVALLDEDPRSATCRARTDCKVALIPAAAFQSRSADDLEIALALQHALARQLASDFVALDKRIRGELLEQRWFT